jgi:hypothetical protein
MTRFTLAILIAAATVSACSQTDGGMQRAGVMSQMRDDAMPYDQARAMCWERAWGAPGGGQGAENAKHESYMACMGGLGWQDPRRPF